MNSNANIISILVTLAIMVILPSWLFMLVISGLGSSISFYSSLAFGVLVIFVSTMISVSSRVKTFK
jgi:hypothetical protein